MTDPTADLIQIIQTQQKTINHLSKVIGSIGASQFLIFRLLMQYDPKMAQAFSGAIDREYQKYQQQKEPPFHPLHGDFLKEFLEIARNPTQRDEKGRPLWIRLVTDNPKNQS